MDNQMIATRDMDEVAKIHSNPQYIDWKMEYLNGEYRFYSPNYKKEQTLTFYHGGSTPNFTIDSIDIYRTSIKQGQNYAGFYMFDEENRDKAFHYAEMASSRLGVKEAGVSKIVVDAKANIYSIQGEVGKIDRLKKEELEDYRNQGFDIITGKSFDGQQYVLLNKEMVKSIEFQTMEMRYPNGEKPNITSPTENIQQQDTYMTLEELEPLLSEAGYLCFGHGTGRTGNSEEVVDSIFEEGLRTKDNSLYFTTIGLSTPTPELKQQYGELGLETPSLDTLKHQLNNWSHADSKKIIIARIPTEYVNELADRSDLGGERYGAFMIEEIDANGKTTNYLDPKFIIGSYDVEKKAVKINKSFERTLTESSLKQLKEKYKKTLEKTQKRLKEAQIIGDDFSPIQIQQNQQEVFPNQELISEQELISDFGEDIDWGFPSLEETEVHGRTL